jgi:hypothetical protein
MEDILMKLLTLDRFIPFQRMLGLISNSYKVADEVYQYSLTSFVVTSVKRMRKRYFLNCFSCEVGKLLIWGCWLSVVAIGTFFTSAC